MNLFKRFTLSVLSFCAFAGVLSAQQNVLFQTSLNAGIGQSQQTFLVGSTSGITALPVTEIYVDLELMLVMAVNGNQVTVMRGMAPTRASSHAAGEMILAGHPDWFYGLPAIGSCSNAAGGVIAPYVSPYVNVVNGSEWLCSSVTGIWGPGWQNSLEPPTTTAAVASAAGTVLPSGPLFHITGTAAITGFQLPLGFSYGSFTVIPDGAFTTTNAGNIAVASTAVVGKALTFTFDAGTARFYPSY